MLREELVALLRSHGIRLNTDLGQHFLVDAECLEDIVQNSGVTKGDRVLEIGPGAGMLTRELLRHGAIVEAIEIDPRMVPVLRDFTAHDPNLTVIQGNALHIDTPSQGPYRVIANIPYHITSPLLTHLLLESTVRPTALTLLIQREVAENICSATTESLLSVLVHLFGTARLVRIVPKESFLPPPKVESAVIHIVCHTEPLVPTQKIPQLLKIVQHAMSQRRKMLRNTIGSLEGGMEALQRTKIEPTRRPQTLTIHEWISLAEALEQAR